VLKLNAAVSVNEHRVILGLGSNINSTENIIRALDLLCQQTLLQQVSSTWESRAVGSEGPNFLNAAAWIETQLSIPDLKERILRPIEAKLGRVRTADKNAPRTIDIDILIFEESLVEPAVWDHAFLAAPVAELLPDFTHPQTGESIQKAAERLARKSRLKPRSDVIPGMWKPPSKSA
jgi:2-amino-4-hydroxy-6-hydroxymethyldihydropteridine diphosphokinase